jgi:uncharacterized protein (DUF1800 family)
MRAVLKLGRTRWLERQLDPAGIDDTAVEASLPALPSDPGYNGYTRGWPSRSIVRMVQSRRQLQERMVLAWMEHFATSVVKAGMRADYLYAQEQMFRRNALANFRQILVDVTKDKAMLIWLDNTFNNGQPYDGECRPEFPINENYARELLQVFSMGPVRLRMDGTPDTDGAGRPRSNYSEDDVKEIARALTGWKIPSQNSGWDQPSNFVASQHNICDKTIFGTLVRGREGAAGAQELDDVVELIVRHPSTAPFVAKTLIQRLVTDAPSPAYVRDVASEFARTDGDVRATVRAIFSNPAFASDTVVRNEYRTPLEHCAAVVRAFGGTVSDANALFSVAARSGYHIYIPPSVFGFYTPGAKSTFYNTAAVRGLEQGTVGLLQGEGSGVRIDIAGLVAKKRLTTPAKAVDFLIDSLLAGPLVPARRAVVVESMEGRVDETKVRGAAMLIAMTPEFHRN